MDNFQLTFTEAITNRFAQILYRCLEEVGSTKGVLYLKVDPEGDFRMVCSYGWPRGTTPPAHIATQDPLLVLVQREKRSFVVSDAYEFPELAPFGQGGRFPRYLVTPLYLAGEWIGLLLQRDRLKGEPFELSRDDRPTLSVCKDLVEAYKEIRALTFSVTTLSPIAQPSVEDLPAAKDLLAEGQATLEPTPPSVGLIPEIPADNYVEGFRNSLRSTGSFSVLPWEQEQLAILGRLEPSKIPLEAQAISDRKPGKFLPEQRAFFWELAGVLLELVQADAVALWVEEPDELRPVLALSSVPLSEALKQQILAHLTFHLTGVEQKQLQLLARPRNKTAEPLDGAFQTLIHLALGVEQGPKDLLFLFRLEHKALTGAEMGRMAQAGRLMEMHLQEGRLHERYHRAFLSVSHRILKSGEGRFPALRSHSLATAKLARNLALRLDLPSTEVEAVSIAAILHDVGTMLLDPGMMAKPTLTAEELAQVRTHPVLASTFLKDFKFPFDVLKIIRHHHERWDGSGYPDGLAGESIPVGSRIIGLIEAFEVMTSGKSYRKVLSLPMALEELEREAGSQFDPAAVEALVHVLKRLKKKE
jgi:putative nucleotidyltransferase with HDIG domain